MDYQITPEWQISLDDSFHHRVEENQLVLWRKGITIVSAAFIIPENLSHEQLIEKLKQRPSTGVLDVYESEDGTLHRLGFIQTETVANEKTRLALHTFTISPNACLQTSFYMDDPVDIPWAKTTWESIQYHISRKDQQL